MYHMIKLCVQAQGFFFCALVVLLFFALGALENKMSINMYNPVSPVVISHNEAAALYELA